MDFPLAQTPAVSITIAYDIECQLMVNYVCPFPKGLKTLEMTILQERIIF